VTPWAKPSAPFATNMNYKLLWIPTTLFASALTLAVACEPCVGEECDFDDGGGEGGTDGGSGGASGGTTAASGGAVGSGGTAAAGGEGGMGGTAQTLDCLASGEPSGTPGACEPIASEGSDSYDCQACAAEYCCDEVEACAATNPETACYYGSTSRLGFDGEPIVGELDCILDCLRELPYEEFVGDQDQVDTCALECGSAECNEDEAGPASVALASCLLGIGNDVAPAGCQEECALIPEP
jgi:hypothetical protein